MRIHGIIPPVATPLKANEDLDLPRLKTFIDELIEAGCHAIFVLGTNSEFYAFSEAEKQEIIATAVAHVNKRRPVFAGTGAETHSHPNEQWIYILEGTFEGAVEGKPFTAKPGTVVYVPANAMHSGKATKDGDVVFFTCKDASHGLHGIKAA